ncbi:PREDICTED: protein argonaute 4 isoform X2 [Tarenaya hassleriana]|nr:PREDICTED: protein argonaute 4 isoform X2 [Tarenaya hassleriana]XP_019056591.1 PREDICTED: protein argonaute 4 isoform X2 [Tarenaya hassleriana]XP_019056592.1 PREDICTED: protein argonaute 4 isoform X2 [Tarenaya hassleriana]
MDSGNGSSGDLDSANLGEITEALLPPPPVIPPNVEPLRVETEPPPKKKNLRVPMARRGLGTKGQKIPLLTNHFKVNVTNLDGYFYHYSVALFYDDGRPVETKGVGRKVLDKLHETYRSDLADKDFAYDGEKTLFTFGALPTNKMDFSVVLEEVSSKRTNGNSNLDSPDDGDKKRMRRRNQSKSFRVEISYAAKIPLQALASAMRGQESENSQEAIRVLDIILRQHAARQGCLLVRQSFFHNDTQNFESVGDGVLGCRGFHSSFRTTQGGMSLNMDVSTTMIIQPGLVLDFLMANQRVKDTFSIDWTKARRVLKNLRVKVAPSNMEYRITGLSEKPCRELTFELKQKHSKNENGEFETMEVTVYDYFLKHHQIELRDSADLPCLNVGKPKRPTYIPLELCELVSLQRYTKALNTFQRSALVERSRQKPQERMNVLSKALKVSNYGTEPILRSCGISISPSFIQVEGRVLPAPKLKTGKGDEIFPRNGRWNFSHKKFFEPVKIERWAVVNFSARCNVRGLVQDLIRCGEMKGISIADPFDVFEENQRFRKAPPMVRVEKMFEEVQSRLPGAPQFLLCLLTERKNCEIYGPWKKKNLTEFGIVTQCMVPMRVNDNYLLNCLMKINAKLGGLNSLLTVERTPAFPIISKVPTIILGMDVSHGSPGQSEIPSIAAVVSSREWPLISRYRASVRLLPPKVEMIDSLFKKSSNGEDEGIIRELLLDFYTSSGKRKPEHIIIFRDGVSESQFNQVLNVELDQVIEACKYLDEKWNPKFLVIVAQKNHHTKFFQPGSPDNVPPGTIVDTKICHPRNYDFYLCAQAGMIGTSRPTHYHVLYDEIGFSPDEVQELVHSLSYVYQRSTTAISVVAPICYAHLAAAQIGTFVKFEDRSETSSSHGGGSTASGQVSVPQLPKLKESVANSMFFC